jgi:benzoyl-CoA-dihydrodiol lyase
VLTVSIDAPVATVSIQACGEQVDVELSDALERVRFEHPEVGMVVVTSARSGLLLETRLDGAAAGPVTGRGPVSEAVVLPPLWPEEFEGGFAYPNVRVEFDTGRGEGTVTLVGPANHECFAPEPGPRRLRSRWWPLAVCREFDDALRQLSARPEIGAIVLRTEGDPLAVASADVALTSGYEHDWFVREVVLSWRRTLQRLDGAGPPVTALVEPGSCFVGTLLELAFAADRITMVDGEAPAELFLTGMNFGPLADAGGRTRLESRFPGRDDHLEDLSRRVGDPIGSAEAVELGLVGDQPSGTSR